ncbi:MAG TPA: NUDIX domain-containing protein [Vicinamibacterales bacterium]|jgi:8-oxo-dGTP pyrophosphatase MutT (NUDIX family)
MADASEIVEQGGGIAFRYDHGILTVLLVTSRRDPQDWIFPKGHIEPGESPDETALRETQEEAGVDGSVVGPAGTPREYKWKGARYRVQYFLIRATSESSSPENRKKAWLPIDEALDRLSVKDLRVLLRGAVPALKEQS